MPDYPPIEFRTIVAHAGAQTAAFEEYCAQLARHVDIPDGSVFQRNGRGADLGVECLWHLPDGSRWGWQAKFVFDIDSLKAQVDDSFDSALNGHPTLTRFYVCFPFDASAAPGRGKSQQDKLRDYKSEWESRATTQGRSVSVIFWPETELADRLLAIDNHGGRRMFWFGEPVLTPDWFEAHVRAALTVAGPRYTPALTVDHPVTSLLDAFGSTSNWDAQLKKWRHAFARSSSDWRRAIGAAASSEIAEFPKALLPEAELLLSEVDTLNSLLPSTTPGVSWDKLRRCTVDTRTRLQPILASLQAALDAKYGAGASRSKRFREFQAEYQAVFPAQYYDIAEEMTSLLAEFAEWLDSVGLKASNSAVLLITGAAGVGKTHSVCDVAASRDALQPKNLSILLFGARLRSGVVWDQLRLQIGLSATWTEDALFDALDAAGEASGRPLIIFVDALNESQPRTIWRTELSPLVAKVRQHTNLRLCITCRTDYANAVVDPSLDIPRFEHPGFAGNAFDACRSFFEFYGLEPPIGPLLDPEFENPLFLKLTCEALRAGRYTRLPVGWSGFRTVFRAVLERQDQEWYAETGAPLRNAVTVSLEALAAEMARRSERTIAIPDAVTQISRLGVDGEAVVRRLLDHQLLMQVAVTSSPQGILSDLREELAFAYERLGDHLQVQAALRAVGAGPIPQPLLDVARVEPGYAEALSIQLPELRSEELLDLIPVEEHESVFAPWLRGLQWRDSHATSERTEYWIRSFMEASRTAWGPIFDAMLAAGARPGHRFENWLSNNLTALELPERDAFWCAYLHRSWEVQALHPVRRLIDSVWNIGDAAVDAAVGVAWLRALCWFFAAADRRVRDRASRAAVHLGERQPSIWVTILKEFRDVDDDYILERVLACAYGTHLRVDNGPALAALADVAVSVLADEVRANALVRDHARCICELALQRELRVNYSSAQVQPPYRSEWPLEIPSSEDFARFASPSVRSQYPNLYESAIDDFRGDFAIYTVPSAISPYRASLGTAAATRWIFQHVLDLGYTPERFRAYDAQMISSYGGGRGREKWAERIGKKYQWIALARLIGRLADHVPIREDEWEDALPRVLTAQRLRDIDVSCAGIPIDEDDNGGRTDSDLSSNRPASDEEWVIDAGEVSEIEQSLWEYQREAGEVWLPLEAHVSRVDRQVRPDDLGFRRQIWLQLRGYLVAKSDFQRLWNWMRSKNFMGRWMPEGWSIYDNVFVGEYPRGLSLGPAGMTDRRPEALNGIKCSVVPATHEISPEFTEDSSAARRMKLTVPVPQLLGGRRWNGRGGYLDDAGRLVFVDPRVEHGGVSGCFVRRQELQEYLDRNDMSLMWTVLAEKLPGNYQSTKRLEFSHVRGFHEGAMRIARDPVVARR